MGFEFHVAGGKPLEVGAFDATALDVIDFIVEQGRAVFVLDHVGCGAVTVTFFPVKVLDDIKAFLGGAEVDAVIGVEEVYVVNFEAVA